MSDPVCISVPLLGDDEEFQVLNACLFVLEQRHITPLCSRISEGISPEARSRIAAYIAARFVLKPTQAVTHSQEG